MTTKQTVTTEHTATTGQTATTKAKGPRRTTVIDRLTQQLPQGTVEWIGLRTARKAAVKAVSEAMALEGLGLEGDRRTQGRPGTARQVTLISAEHLIAVASILQRETIAPELVRRNIVVSGININALRYRQFRIGEAVFEATAYCHPCSRMEENLGKHGFAAMLGHGGLCAKILKSGMIKTGDQLIVEDLE